MGGTAMKDGGPSNQVLGCIIGSIAIFLPSALLVLFFYPVWHNLKKYATVYRAMEGINAVVVGILMSASLYMAKDIPLSDWKTITLNMGVMAGTWALLSLFGKLPSPVIVACLFVPGMDILTHPDSLNWLAQEELRICILLAIGSQPYCLFAIERFISVAFISASYWLRASNPPKRICFPLQLHPDFSNSE